VTIGAETNRCIMNKKSQLTVSFPGIALLFLGFVLLHGQRLLSARLATLRESDEWSTPILIMEIVAFWTAVAAFIASAVVQIRAKRQWARRSNEISK